MNTVKEVIFGEFLCSDRRFYNQARINRYKHTLDVEDLQAEFDLGALMALKKCNPAADPLKYLCLQGFNRVRHVVQSHLRRSLIQACLKCGKVRTFKYTSPCDGCKGKSFQNISRYETIDTENPRV